jgi:hypothetical protein
MACIVHFEINGHRGTYILCLTNGDPIRFKDCDEGWGWVGKHHDRIDFLTTDPPMDPAPAPGHIILKCVMIGKRSVDDAIRESLGQNWKPCLLKADVGFP